MIRAILLAVFVLQIHAYGLEWNSRRVEVRPGPDDNAVIAKFDFFNSGESTIRVRRQEGCRCLSVQPNAREYLPGHRGYVLIAVGVEGLRYTENRSVTVEFQVDGLKDALVEPLLIGIIVDEQVRVDPDVLVTGDGEDLLMVHIPPGISFDRMSVNAETDDFEVQLSEPVGNVDDGFICEITVRYDPGNIPGRSNITVALENAPLRYSSIEIPVVARRYSIESMDPRPGRVAEADR